MIMRYDFKPSISYLSDGHRHHDLHTPSVQVTEDDYSMIKKTLQNQTVTIELSAGELNIFFLLWSLIACQIKIPGILRTEI